MGDPASGYQEECIELNHNTRTLVEFPTIPRAEILKTDPAAESEGMMSQHCRGTRDRSREEEYPEDIQDHINNEEPVENMPRHAVIR